MKLILKVAAFALAAAFALSSFCVAAAAADYKNAGTKGDTGVSASYQDSKYYKNMLRVPLTGDNPTDVLAIALSQLGYTESNDISDLGGLSGGNGNFTEYNYNFGDYTQGYGYHWCASFASFCLYQSGTHGYNKLKDWCRDHPNEPEYIWRELGCERWRISLAKFGYFRTSGYYSEESKQNFGSYYNPDYTPSSGDLIFFTENPYKTATHIGFVLYVDGEDIYTVEGNTSPNDKCESDGNGVHLKSYKTDDPYIIGYGDMPYKRDDSVQKPDYSGKNPTSGLYMSKSDIPLYSCLASMRSGDAERTVPKYTMLSVSIVGENKLVQCELDGKTVTGYIDGQNTVQLSCGEISIDAPPETYKRGGCRSALDGSVAFLIIPIFLCGIVFKKKKSNR